MRNMSLLDGDTVTTAARGWEFWRGVLLAGGFTAVPRWTLDPVPGVAEHEAKICNEVVAALRRLADELALPLSSVLLTAHAKVLGALSGECKVSTGYSFEGRPPLLCRFTTEPRSWRALLLKADRAQSELLAHKDFPVHDLRREMGLINGRARRGLRPQDRWILPCRARLNGRRSRCRTRATDPARSRGAAFSA